uniref:hypothetical protein n=1 Tax=Sulfurivirga sp. TaxID=2614236 RepID=UPI0025E40277
MKKWLAGSALALLLTAAGGAQAGCCGWGNDDPYDDNDWPEWTPMYWMEEFFDDDDDYPPPYGYGYPPPPPAYGYGYPPPPPGYGYPPPSPAGSYGPPPGMAPPPAPGGYPPP